MYKGKRKVLMKVLSLALAAGMGISGLPVSALAADTADADVQEEAVVEPETAIEPAEDSDETQEAQAPAEVEEAASSVVEQEVTEEMEEKVPAEEVPAEEEEELPEESIIVDAAEEVEQAQDLAKGGAAQSSETPLVGPEFIDAGIIEIDGVKYGVDGDGFIYNQLFCVQGGPMTEDSFYCASEDGSIVINDWRQSQYGGWYYFGEDGQAACGFTQIDGSMYYFYEGGYYYWSEHNPYHYDRFINHSIRALCTVGAVYDEENDTSYLIADDGVATALDITEGWLNLDNGDTYYLTDGESVLYDVIEVDGKYYGFAKNGKMFKDTVFLIVKDDDGGVRYHAHEDGHLYANEWAQEGEDRYYYSENGKPMYGFYKIDGEYYLFDWRGKMQTNTTYTDHSTGNVYVIGDDGVARLQVLDEDGWVEKDGRYYYAENGSYVKNTVKKIGGVYYGFDYNGRMFDDEAFILERKNHNGDGDYDYIVDHYRAKKGGALYTNTWYEEKFGYDEEESYSFWCYYGADAKRVTGWKQFGGKWYYFNEDGEMVTGLQEIDGTLYSFKDSGEMTTGWVENDGSWYYIENSGALAKGWKQIGSWYFFDDEGKMATGLQEINGVSYFFGDSGAMQTGWKEIDGDWYFFNNSGAMVKGWQAAGGVWYYFDGEGKMLTGLQEISGAKYYFTAGGAMKTGWQQIDGAWYYFAGSGAAVKDWQKLGGVWYYFDEEGEMLTGLQEISGAKYYFTAGGAMKTGWQQVGDDWYYFEASGAAACSKWIGNYYMTQSGVMATNQWVDNHKYYVGADGLWIPNYTENVSVN